MTPSQRVQFLASRDRHQGVLMRRGTTPDFAYDEQQYPGGFAPRSDVAQTAPAVQSPKVNGGLKDTLGKRRKAIEEAQQQAGMGFGPRLKR